MRGKAEEKKEDQASDLRAPSAFHQLEHLRHRSQVEVQCLVVALDLVGCHGCHAQEKIRHGCGKISDKH